MNCERDDGQSRTVHVNRRQTAKKLHLVWYDRLIHNAVRVSQEEESNADLCCNSPSIAAAEKTIPWLGWWNGEHHGTQEVVEEDSGE